MNIKTAALIGVLAGGLIEQIHIVIEARAETPSLRIGSGGTTMLSITPAYKMTFVGKDGRTIGVLDFGGPRMTFEGDADESAKVFLDFVSRRFELTCVPRARVVPGSGP